MATALDIDIEDAPGGCGRHVYKTIVACLNDKKRGLWGGS